MKRQAFQLACALLSFSALCHSFAGAQNITAIKGVVRGIDFDGSKPLPGATLQWLGTKIGTNVGKDGVFILKRPDGATRLIARHASFRPDTLEIAPDVSEITIELREPIITEDITVVGETAAITKATAKTEIISSHDLSKSACCSLSESFEKNASAEASYSDAATGAKQIQLLGLRGIYTQILTEATPSLRGLATPYGADYFPGPWLESISISKGAASVASGYESITGQINIELKKPQIADPFFFNGYLNDMGRYEINSVSTLNTGANSDAAFMLHGRKFSSKTDQNNDGFLDMPNFQQINGLARWHYGDGAIESQFVARALSDRYDGGQVQYNPETDRGSNALYGTGSRTSRYEAYAKFGALEAAHDPDIAIAMILGATWHDQQSYFGLRDYKGLQKTIYGKAIARIAFSENDYIMAGASWLTDNYDERFIDTSFRRIENVPGAFFEYTSAPTPKLTVIAGLRTDFHNLYGTILTPRLHLKYALTDYVAIRGSAGSGFRSPNIIADNFSAFANSRRIVIEPDISYEKAWNYGVSLTATFEALNMPATFDAEIYRTTFSQQLTVDFDRSPREIHLGNLHGLSYANSALAQLSATLAKGLDITVAWRINDVRATTSGILQSRPLTSVHRALGTISYATGTWQFDATMIWNSGGRIPKTDENPGALRLPDSYNGFFRANAQIAKIFGDFNVYLGVENIANYIQPSPIIDSRNPFSKYFDASLVWGPLDARTFYAGFRLSIPRGE